MILPNKEDGVAFITQYAIYPGLSYNYRFPLKQDGTFWMHAHYGLQEQKLLSAPLIVHGPDDHTISDQEVVMFLSDFSFKAPTEILRDLRCQKMNMEKEPDIIDVRYDAFLTNLKTLEHPEVIHVHAGSKVRLRIIDGACSTNFFLFLGDLQGEAIAVDGNKIKPIAGSKFELGVAQRIDLVVSIPQEGGIFPVFAQGEGTDMRTGLILTTTSQVPSFSSTTKDRLGRITNKQESEFSSLSPFPNKAADQKWTLVLGGNMSTYDWTIDGQSWPASTPLIVEQGQRIEILFKNVTSMSHPMHLHGHIFKVTAINGKAIDGALRDTVIVPPHSTLTIEFDADNPGVWPLHCHLLYHQESGMFTVVRYKEFIQTL
jgi:FtsP/CotA-like multicopper oxidase with cupredoxin domain